MRISSATRRPPRHFSAWISSVSRWSSGSTSSARARSDVLAAVGCALSLAERRPRLREPASFLARPLPPPLRVRVRHLVVEQKRAARLQHAVEPAQRFLVLSPGAADAEHPAGDHRAVAARGCERVQRLHEQRRLEPLTPSVLAAEGDHVGRDVAPVDVEPGTEPGQQQPARAASGVERRLPDLDEPPVVVDLRTAVVQRGPVLGDEAVVPRLGRAAHSPSSSFVSRSPKTSAEARRRHGRLGMRARTYTP